MLEPLALQEFSVPGAILPFYSRGSQTPTDSTKKPTGGQVEEGIGGGEEREQRAELSILAACQSVLPPDHTGIQVCCPKEARQAGDKGTSKGRAEQTVKFPAWEVKSSQKKRWVNFPRVVWGLKAAR